MALQMGRSHCSGMIGEWLRALEHCLAGYGFSHTLARYCPVINDGVSIIV